MRVLVLSTLICLCSVVLFAADDAKKKHEANRLVDEKSPYLLQHAYNPVHWYPWGEEAFKAAREAGKPIFLSIGYSTCHWCHVMERESFENEEIAKIINDDFIAIKVDREERPDVDDVYMTAVIETTGRGGWPLSAFLTAKGKPFLLGTYFPPEDRPGRAGFKTLLGRVLSAWKDDRKSLDDSADFIFSKIDSTTAGVAPAKLPWTRRQLESGYSEIVSRFDESHGGFGGPPSWAPKFPRTSNLDFLMAYHAMTGEARALEVVKTTLDHMARGGVYDHLGEGFHRYSVDREWAVPHFEKMLYDNSLIPRTYFNYYRLTGDTWFLDVAKNSLSYLLGCMQHGDGGFYSAEDADSEGEEGKFYVFNLAETVEYLGKEAGAIFASRYGISEAGNFEHTDKTVLYLAATIDEVVKKHKKPAEEIRASLAASKKKLLAIRNKRIPPLKDDKILIDWNGLALSAFSIAHQVTGDAVYLQAAERAFEFLTTEMMKDDGLIHRYRLGEARFKAYLEGYAFLTDGLLDLYEATLDRHYLREARRLGIAMISRFWDAKNGAFFVAGPEHEQLIIKTKEFYDGAIPSGNSVATFDLVRLSAYTGDATLSKHAEILSRVAAANLNARPSRYPQMLVAASFALSPRIDIVIVGEANNVETEALVRALHRRYLPARCMARVTAETFEEAKKDIAWLKGIEKIENKTDGAYALLRMGSDKFSRAADAVAMNGLLDAMLKSVVED
jgi:uncharacterized protein YyaL (SSP411 family)